MERAIAVSDGAMECAISSIGTAAFGTHLDSLVNDIVSVDFCSCYRIEPDAITLISLSDPDRFESAQRIGSYSSDHLWSADPSLRYARSQLQSGNFTHARLARRDIDDFRLRNVVYTDLVDRVLICRRTSSGIFAISALRWRDSAPFNAAEIEALLQKSSLITALVDRHFVSSSVQASPVDAFTSVELVERCFRAATPMPARECAVCARIVLGSTVAEIARELDIGIETVRSYVKRAYQRFGIASQRELTIVYLRSWHAWTRPDLAGRA